MSDPCEHFWELGDGCDDCGDDHCMAYCITCGEKDWACDE